MSYDVYVTLDNAAFPPKRTDFILISEYLLCSKTLVLHKPDKGCCFVIIFDLLSIHFVFVVRFMFEYHDYRSTSFVIKRYGNPYHFNLRWDVCPS